MCGQESSDATTRPPVTAQQLTFYILHKSYGNRNKTLLSVRMRMRRIRSIGISQSVMPPRPTHRHTHSGVAVPEGTARRRAGTASTPDRAMLTWQSRLGPWQAARSPL